MTLLPFSNSGYLFASSHLQLECGCCSYKIAHHLIAQLPYLFTMLQQQVCCMPYACAGQQPRAAHFTWLLVAGRWLQVDVLMLSGEREDERSVLTRAV